MVLFGDVDAPLAKYRAEGDSQHCQNGTAKYVINLKHKALRGLLYRAALALWRLRHNTARPNIRAADQAQPVDAPILFSSPPGLTRWSMLTRFTLGEAPWIAGSSPAMTIGVGVTFLLT